MEMIGAPTERDFQGMVRHNYIKDCPVTNEDVVNAHNYSVPISSTSAAKQSGGNQIK
jgi:hypothetical protein